MLFEELNKIEYYDDIWACSCILHLSKTDLKNTLKRMTDEIKDDGIIYTSFKLYESCYREIEFNLGRPRALQQG